MNGPKSRQRNHKIAESFQSKTKAPAATQEGDLGGFGGVLSTSIAKPIYAGQITIKRVKTKQLL